MFDERIDPYTGGLKKDWYDNVPYDPNKNVLGMHDTGMPSGSFADADIHGSVFMEAGSPMDTLDTLSDLSVSDAGDILDASGSVLDVTDLIDLSDIADAVSSFADVFDIGDILSSIFL